MTTPHDAARDAARGLIETLSAAGRVEPVAVRVESPGVRVTIRVVAVRAGPTPCERDLLAALAEAECPWTTTRVLAELDRRGMVHGETTVKRALARLVRRGLVTSSAAPPRGYALADRRRPAPSLARGA